MKLSEVPGALERPGDCPIEVDEDDDHAAVTITIPPRPLPWALTFLATLLLMNLGVMLVTGLALFFGHRSVLVMTQISPHGLPLPLRPWVVWMTLGWLAVQALGTLALAVMLRPALMRESISISRDGVKRRHSLWGRLHEAHMPRAGLRGFYLARDPQRLVQSTLLVRGAERELTVAEHAAEADREWLLSVGNVFLRRYGLL